MAIISFEGEGVEDMVSGRPDFQVGIKLEESIRQLSSLKLMDIGEVIHKAGNVTNGIITLYTVPSGYRLYIYYVFVAGYISAAVSWKLVLSIYDGLTLHYLIHLWGTSDTPEAHFGTGYTFIYVPEGSEIRFEASQSDVNGFATFTGVLVPVEG